MCVRACVCVYKCVCVNMFMYVHATEMLHNYTTIVHVHTHAQCKSSIDRKTYSVSLAYVTCTCNLEEIRRELTYTTLTRIIMCLSYKTKCAQSFGSNPT